MTLQTTQFCSRATTQATSAGTSLVPVSVGGAGGTADTFTPGSNVFLYIVNGAAASSATVTVAVPGARTFEQYVAVTSPAFSVQAGQTKLWGPVDAQTFADPTTGLASVTYSQGTVTAAVVQLG